jgi:hypothetical protein
MLFGFFICMRRKKSNPIERAKELLRESRDFIKALNKGATSSELAAIKDSLKKGPRSAPAIPAYDNEKKNI